MNTLDLSDKHWKRYAKQDRGKSLEYEIMLTLLKSGIEKNKEKPKYATGGKSQAGYHTSQSVDTGTLPSRWRIAMVTPLYKGERKLEPNSYTPLGLTLRRHMLDKQPSFRNGRSCLTNILIASENWTKLLSIMNLWILKRPVCPLILF